MLKMDPQPPSLSFASDGSAPLRTKLRNYYKHPLKEYASVFGLSEKNGERTIKRWVSAGRHATPPAPPPLDEPWRMATWWHEHMDGDPSQLLRDLESQAPHIPEPEAVPSIPASERSSPSASVPEDPTVPATPTPPQPILSVSMNLNELALDDDEQVRQMAALVQACWLNLLQATEARDFGNIKRWRAEYHESAQALDRTKKWASERKKADREWLPTGPILAEISQLIESMRIARSIMDVKIIAELERQLEGRPRRILRILQPHLSAAIQKVRAREDDLLCNIDSLRSANEVKDAFVLVAA
jgi:hypothetical protein